MSLADSLKQFHSERAETTSRNIGHARPTAPVRTSTPTPANAPEKRSHDAAFPQPAAVIPSGGVGKGILERVHAAIDYAREKSPATLTFESIISYLSLPNDLRAKEHLFHRALKDHPRISFAHSAESEKAIRAGATISNKAKSRDLFKYKPLHPVTNADELLSYLASKKTAEGVAVKELKDGWPEASPAVDSLERRGHVLVLRNKKDNSARHVWLDDPRFHIINPATQQVKKADADFAERWQKFKLPPNENDIRNELERAGLTPTSAVKEVETVSMKKKERKRVERKNGKKTNVHMAGILKDYSKMKPGAK